MLISAFLYRERCLHALTFVKTIEMIGIELIDINWKSLRSIYSEGRYMAKLTDKNKAM